MPHTSTRMCGASTKGEAPGLPELNEFPPDQSHAAAGISDQITQSLTRDLNPIRIG
jgi:hypothetical protein